MREPEYPGKTTELPQVNDKFYHIKLYTSPEQDSKSQHK
jgi:hypothetical protein